MKNLIEYLRSLVEVRAFGVCAYLGDRMGIASGRVRLFFVYATFIATWSPLILYLILAFWVNMRHYFKERQRLKCLEV